MAFRIGATSVNAGPTCQEMPDLGARRVMVRFLSGPLRHRGSEDELVVTSYRLRIGGRRSWPVGGVDQRLHCASTHATAAVGRHQ